MTEKLIPFDLETYKNYELITRSGKKVIAIYHIKEFDEHKTLSNILFIFDSNNYLWSYSNGKQENPCEYDRHDDVLMKKKSKTYWVNIHRISFNKIHAAGVYENEEDALSDGIKDILYGYIKTISFEVEE